MARKKSSVLLKVVSFIFFLWGILFAVKALLELLGGGASFGFMEYAGVVSGWVGAVIEFICGYFGLKGKHLGLGRILAYLLLAIVVYTFIMSVKDGFGISDCITLVNIVLPVLYIAGIGKAKSR